MVLWPAWCSWPPSASQAPVSTDPSHSPASGGNFNNMQAAATGMAPTPAPPPMAACRAPQHPPLRCLAQVRAHTGGCPAFKVLPGMLPLWQSCRQPCVLCGPVCCTGSSCPLDFRAPFGTCAPTADTVSCCPCRRNDSAASHATDAHGLRHACPTRLRADGAAAGTSGQGVHLHCTPSRASSSSSLWHSSLPGTSSVRDAQHTRGALPRGAPFQHGLASRASREHLRHAPHTSTAQLCQHRAFSHTGSQGHGHPTSRKQPSTR